MKKLLSVWVLGGLMAVSASAFAEVHQIQEVAVEINGTKFWFPSTITVKKGDTVKIHAVNKVPAAKGAKAGTKNSHGFAIPAFKIAVEVDAQGAGNDVEFVADKAGIFPMLCHLHPAHVGGQVVVLD